MIDCDNVLLRELVIVVDLVSVRGGDEIVGWLMLFEVVGCCGLCSGGVVVVV